MLLCTFLISGAILSGTAIALNLGTINHLTGILNTLYILDIYIFMFSLAGGIFKLFFKQSETQTQEDNN